MDLLIGLRGHHAASHAVQVPKTANVRPQTRPPPMVVKIVQMTSYKLHLASYLYVQVEINLILILNLGSIRIQNSNNGEV